MVACDVLLMQLISINMIGFHAVEKCLVFLIARTILWQIRIIGVVWVSPKEDVDM